MRDWAIIGGLTCTLAPGVVGMSVMPELIRDGFVTWAALLGLTSGAGVGWLAHWGLSRVPERSWLAAALVLGVPILGTWGALVSGLSALLSEPGFFAFAVPCGSLSALLVTSWLAPLYAVLAKRDRARLPLVVMGPLLGGPVCGMACLLSVVGLINLVDGL